MVRTIDRGRLDRGNVERELERLAKAERAALEAECQRLRDALASRPAPEASVPEFQQLPPAVASALAKAWAGQPSDVQRQMRAKAGAMLAQGETEATVAAAILQGEPVEL